MFWIRVRAKGDIKVPAEWCGSPRSYPHFAFYPGEPGNRITVELVVAPINVTDVRLVYRNAKTRTVALDPPPQHAEAVGLKENFRFTTQVFKGRKRVRSATYYDAAGNLVHEFPIPTIG